MSPHARAALGFEISKHRKIMRHTDLEILSVASPYAAPSLELKSVAGYFYAVQF